MTRLLQTITPKSRRQSIATYTLTTDDKNVYRIRYSLPAEKNGKQKRVAETVRGTKKEAEKTLRKRLASVDSSLYVNKHKETVSEFMSRWMETYAATNWRSGPPTVMKAISTATSTRLSARLPSSP